MLILPARKPLISVKPPYGARINRAHPLAVGLSGGWLENEGAGKTLYDLSGNGNTGAPGVGVSWASGQFGPCLSFSGASTAGVLFGSPQVLSTPAMSLAIWVYATSLPQAYNSAIGRDASNDYCQILVKSTGKLALYVFATASLNYDGTGTFTLSTKQWYHVVLTYNSVAGLKGYVNGKLDGSAAANGTIKTVPGTFSVGTGVFNASRYWNGLLDVPLTWNRALSAAEVQQLYVDPFCFMRRRNIAVWRKKALSQFNALLLAGD